MTKGLEGHVDQMAGRCEAWHSGLEGTGQRGRLGHGAVGEEGNRDVSFRLV